MISKSFTQYLYLAFCCCLLVATGNIQAQSLTDQINNIFDEVLNLEQSGLPGIHGDHFIAANVANNGAIIGAFSNFITTNVSSFPLSSTAAGVAFDFSSGTPTKTTTSLGPIFSERAQTLGRNRINMGFNFSYLNLNKIRGVNTEDIRFSFFHEDLFEPGLGDISAERDYIDMLMNLDLNASILAFSGTWGITNHIDIGIAVPFVSVQMKATPVATMNSITGVISAAQGNYDPLHYWGTPDNRQLILEPTPIDDDATGIGDIALRAKYNFIHGKTVDFSTLLEYRLPTGDEADFLGSGSNAFKIQLIASGTSKNFSPHVNVGYEYRGSELDKNEIELFVGFDQKVNDQLTLAIDFLGELEVGSEIEALRFPDPVDINIDVGSVENPWIQTVTPTNIPNLKNDHSLNGAFGLKFSPKTNLVVVGNVIVPLNDGGLRSDFVTTLGFDFSF